MLTNKLERYIVHRFKIDTTQKLFTWEVKSKIQQLFKMALNEFMLSIMLL